jgi:hypothetical protein
MERRDAVFFGAVIAMMIAPCVVASCTGEQRRIARDVLDVIEVVCAPTDDRDSCLDKLVAMRARETGVAGSASAAGPVAPPPANGSFSDPSSATPAPSGSVLQ